MTIRCPHCGHAIPVTLNVNVSTNVSTKDGQRTEEEWIELARRKLPRRYGPAVNAIAGPGTIPPRGAR